MTVSTPDWVNNPTAERLYSAFQKILAGELDGRGRPIKLSSATVAQLAGFQRSTLSKARFPELRSLIDKHNKEHGSERKHPRTASAASEEPETEARGDSYDVLLSKYLCLAEAFVAAGVQLPESQPALGGNVVGIFGKPKPGR